MDAKALKMQQNSEQEMSMILNERGESLDNFLFDRASERDICNVKAFISFAQAAHYASQCHED